LSRYLLLLSFLEGGAVMACELLGARITAPFFGNSLYVWAAVLGITLCALMTGYYLGGLLSHRWRRAGVVYAVLALAGLALALMPALGRGVMPSTLALPVQWGATLALLCFLFPPLMLMGAVSPLIVQQLQRDSAAGGRAAGTVFAVSTLGGIVSTFAMGFYLLPEFGIRWPAFAYGTALIAFSLPPLLGPWWRGLVLSLVLALCGYLLLLRAPDADAGPVRVLHQSEGILGQLRVIEQPYLARSGATVTVRALLVNNYAHTLIDNAHPARSMWDYPQYMSALASRYPAGSAALLLGLGGGTLYKQLTALGLDTDAVELDARVADVAQRYFHLQPDARVIVDDARHYLNVTDKRYALLAVDLFLNETPPSHVLTREALTRMRQVLTPGGMILINFYGYVSGERGRALGAVVATLQAAGLQVRVLATPGSEGARNLVLMATADAMPLSDPASRADPELLQQLSSAVVDPAAIQVAGAPVLTDERSPLEKLYLPAALDWRRGSNLRYTRTLLRAGVDPFP
jgi:predicted membrane-bound spermidine synthase